MAITFPSLHSFDNRLSCRICHMRPAIQFFALRKRLRRNTGNIPSYPGALPTFRDLIAVGTSLLVTFSDLAAFV
jgi:hypothetical protein